MKYIKAIYVSTVVTIVACENIEDDIANELYLFYLLRGRVLRSKLGHYFTIIVIF